MNEPVVITGVGVTSALGRTAKDHFDRLLGGVSAVVRYSSKDDACLGPLFEASVGVVDRRSAVDSRMLRKILSDRACFARMAAGDAVRNAGLADDPDRRRRAGLYVGSICLEMDPNGLAEAVEASRDDEGKFDLARFGARGIQLLDPLFLTRSLPNGGAAAIAIELQILGPNVNLTNGPTSGLQGVMAAADAIGRGEIEIAIAGGFDSLRPIDAIVEHLLARRFCSDGKGPDSCRPFDRYRSGYPIGEGAAFLVLESRRSAKARGAVACAELIGWADRTDVCSGAVDGGDRDWATKGGSLADAAIEAVEIAAWDREEIDVVFGDALAVAADDDREIAALERLFGSRRVAYSGATPAIGFTGAAAGAFTLAHAALALDKQVVPPTLNCKEPVEGAPAVQSAALSRALRSALAWCSDQGTKSSAVLLRSVGSRG